MEERNFLNKGITIKKIDSSWLRGSCIHADGDGFTLVAKDSYRTVFVPMAQVSEIMLSDNNG
jgi:hypothetical protein